MTADSGQDPFDNPKSSFVRVEDLLGRTVVIVPIKVIEAESTMPGSQGKKYEKVIADTIVLDGPVTDLIDEIPFTTNEMHWSGSAVVGQLKPNVRTRKPIIAFVEKQPARTRGFQDAWILREVTDKGMRDAGAKAFKAYQDQMAEASDPFAS